MQCKKIAAVAFVGGFVFGLQYGLINTVVGGVGISVVVLLVVYAKPHHTPIE
jgi:hypothetical protein